MFITPDLSYQFTVHLPLYQGEAPVVAVVRRSPDDVRLVRITEIKGRSFHNDIMPALVAMADKLVEIDKTPECYAHIIFSGLSMGGAEFRDLLGPHWRDESWSYIKLASGGVEPILDTSDERLPLNQFKIPRMSIINSINHAYNAPGRIYMSISSEDAIKLDEQLGLFAERTATIPRNDPDALLEHKGEGRVIAFGVALWHHFHAKAVKAGWAKDVREMAG